MLLEAMFFVPHQLSALMRRNVSTDQAWDTEQTCGQAPPGPDTRERCPLHHLRMREEKHKKRELRLGSSQGQSTKVAEKQSSSPGPRVASSGTLAVNKPGDDREMQRVRDSRVQCPV